MGINRQTTPRFLCKTKIASFYQLFHLLFSLDALFSNSEEAIGFEGLNIIPGKVVKLKEFESVRIPHTGWNRLIPVSQPCFFGFAYFNHSYYCLPEDNRYICSNVHHGISFPAIVVKENVIGTQFHPEKSKASGNAILNYFASLIRRDDDGALS